MRQFEITQKLSLLAQKGIDDHVNYGRLRTKRAKNQLNKSAEVKTGFDRSNIQLKLFEL